MRTPLVLMVVAALAAGCGGSSGTVAASAPPSSDPTAAAAGALPIGKELISLEARTYGSPEGFAPALTVDVPAGWSSVHRYDDAFDVTQPDPTRDAPAVAILWLTPAQPTAAQALATIRSAAGSAAQPVSGRIGTTAAAGLEIAGGTGPVVESARRGISIDNDPAGRMRVLAADVGGKPLVVVLVVPVAAAWARYEAVAQPLIDSTRPA